MLYILEKIKYLAGLEKKLAARLKESSLTFLRISLGLVFTWFGLLKFFPGISPAEEIATSTIALLTHGFITPLVSLKILAAWEVLIGLGFLHGKYIRLTALLFFLQMTGAMAPLFILPSEAFSRLPWAPTLEGQYIIKNVVLIASVVVIWANHRN